MNILEVLSVHIPSDPSGESYEVPLNDILLSHQLLEQGCPVEAETECPPLFQTRLINLDVLNDFVKAWSRLEASVCQGGGEVVVRDTNGKVQRLDSGREDAKLNVTDMVRERGLDETLSQTFPCSDALSSIPDPSVESGISAKTPVMMLLVQVKEPRADAANTTQGSEVAGSL
jgi:hypothetical protein